jgi:hypothetical protein
MFEGSRKDYAVPETRADALIFKEGSGATKTK